MKKYSDTQDYSKDKFKNLYSRIASELGWNISDVHSFPLIALRTYVRSEKLKYEISCVLNNPEFYTLKN
jgi:hypothetical protein